MASNRTAERWWMTSSNATTVQVFPRWMAMPTTKTKPSAIQKAAALTAGAYLDSLLLLSYP